jgi:DNA-binding NtrC family response regulator
LSLTVLLVEDSLFACEAVRLLCLKSGARIRRADCLASARRHLRVYRPSVVIVDMGLPDGSGAELISELATAHPRVPVLLGISGDAARAEEAVEAGADGFLEKPLLNLGSFQSLVLGFLPEEQRPKGMRLVSNENVEPDEIAYRDDMAHVASILADVSDGKTVDYVTQFLGGVARSARDKPLQRAVAALSKKRASGGTLRPDVAHINKLLQERIDSRSSL